MAKRKPKGKAVTRLEQGHTYNVIGSKESVMLIITGSCDCPTDMVGKYEHNKDCSLCRLNNTRL